MRFAGGATANGMTIGDERDRIALIDQTLSGNAKIRTAQRKTTAAQSAA
jgi:hypothetical protein